MGAGNILSLLFEINANPENAQRAIDNFRSSSLSSLGEFGSGVDRIFRGITSPAAVAVGAIAGIGGALFSMSKRTAEAGTAIFEASKKTGISAEKLSGLRMNSKLLSENFDSLTLSLGRASKGMAEGLGNASSQTGKDLLGLLGSQKALTEFGLLPMEDRVAKLTKRIFEQNDVGERNRLLMEFFGRGALQNISTLQKLAEEGYDPAIARAKAFGQFFTGESAAQMRQYMVAFESAKAQIEGLALSIGAKAVPAFTQLMGLIAGNKNMTAEFNAELRLLSIGLGAQVTSLTNFFGMNDEALAKFAEMAQETEDERVRAMMRFKADMQAFAGALKGAAGAFDTHTKAAKDSTWQLERLLGDIRQFTSISQYLQSQLDSGTSPALRRYLEVEQRLVDLSARLDVSMLRRQNQALYQKQLTEELADATSTLNGKLTDQGAISQFLGNVVLPRLTAEERVRLPLIYDETNALARMLQNSRAAVSQMVGAELPARQRIEIQIQRQMDAARREIIQYRQWALEKKTTLAELEAAEEQYAAVVESLSAQRQAALHQDTMAQISAVVAQGAALLDALGKRKTAAIVEAVWETAQGIAALARYDFWSAAQHFLAAATYGVVAGQSSKSASFNASVSAAATGGGVGVAAGTAVRPAPLAPGAASAAARGQQPSGSSQPAPIIIQIQGDFLATPHSADTLAAILSDAVEQRDVKLTARRALLPTYAAR